MNEINFRINDIKEIKMTMDVGVKEIYPPIENLEVTPSNEEQIFTHENSYGYDKVTVNGVTLQDKQVTPSKENQVIQSDSEYIGLNEVTVNAIPDNYIEPTGTLEITTNGEHDVTNYKKVIGNIHEITPYAPKYITFRNYNVVNGNLDYEVANLDTSNITDMTDMFYGCQYVASLNVSHFNTSNVKKMVTMFYYCQRITTMDIGNWDASKVTDINNMFGFCDHLEHVVLPRFSTSMKSPTQVFRGCSKLKTADVSGLVTDNATSFTNMFVGCYELTTIDVSHFNTNNVTGMENMFSTCKALTTLDLSNFNTEKVTNMNYMFNGCTALTHLDIRNFDFTKVKYYTNMFSNVPANCEIIVKDNTAKEWVLARRSDFTNVKTVAEL